MKKMLRVIILALYLFFVSFNIQAKEKITLYLFYGKECPHCEEERNTLIKNLKKRGDINIVEYEVWHNNDNSLLLDKVNKFYKNKSAVPYNVIGDSVIVGYNEGVKNKILRAINYYKNNEYIDKVDLIKKNNSVIINDKFSELELHSDKSTKIKIPFIGDFNIKNLSISMSAVLMGLVDGFNPCSMWILLFLISTMISLNDKKKMLIYGSVFIITSSLVYFLIMFSWLNIIISISLSIVFKVLLGIFALISGSYSIYKYFKLKNEDIGCEVVSKEKRKNIFSRITKSVNNKNIFLAILGIVLLAISVNLVELLCSAGLPVMFSEILAINNISGSLAIGYNLIYVFFFMLDDLIIFIIAVKSMDIIGFSNKYNKIASLVGGIIMIVIGLLLFLKPEWLMFNF